MENVADIYPLSPVQAGMLFHTLAAPHSGVYVVQLTCLISGDVQPAVFRDAWQNAVERHPVLRTAVLWEGLDEPLQAVRTEVELPWRELDWRGVPDDRIVSDLEVLLREDRFEGFELCNAPLMRFRLIRVGDASYRFVWSFHHIVLDGWSTVALLREVLSENGAGAGRDSGAEVTAEPRPYRDFIAWSRGQDLGAAEAFWRAQLKGIHSPTPLGVKRSVRRAGPPDHRSEHLVLAADVSDELRKFARVHRITLNTLVRGAWAVLLSRYSGDSHVVYGAAVAGRPTELEGVQEMVGTFVSTVPVRVGVARDAELLPWLRDVQQRQIDTSPFEHTPLTSISEWSDMPVAGDLFESLLVFENVPLDEEALAEGTRLEVGDIRYLDQSNYPLALLVFPGRMLRLSALYEGALFDDWTIRRLLEQLRDTLLSFARNSEKPLGEHAPPHESESRLIAAWSRGASAWQGATSPEELRPNGGGTASREEPPDVWAMFESLAVRNPRAPAVIHEGGDMDYAELRRRCSEIARRLMALGVGAGSRVALHAERGPEMLVGLFGILAAGGAYVPLEPSHPEERIRFVLEDSGAEILVTDSTPMAFHFPVDRILRISDLVPSDAGADAPPPRATPTDLAYVMYTSGSTGTPKGVGVTRGNLFHSNAARRIVYGGRPERFVLLSPFVFDSSVVGIFWPLLSGGAVVSPPPGLERDPRAIGDLISRTKATHTLCLPSLYSLILEQATPGALESLETVIVAGEACPPSVVRDHQALLPNTRLYNEYGPTEGTVWCTAFEVPYGFDGDFVPIGKPIPGAQVYVLDSAGTRVPIGVPGEILVGGAGVAKGYVSRPELTEERFRADYLSEEPSARVYATGDVARWTENGVLEFSGRIDRQVKIRGYRIEPGEIESVLLRQPSIQEAVVVASGASEESGRNDRVEPLVSQLEDLGREEAKRLLEEIERLPEPTGTQSRSRAE